jgi:acetaldehyde dehydrogenase
MGETRVAIIGSGNIGTDLMIKIAQLSQDLEMAVMVGIDPASDGLARARSLGVEAVPDGVEGLIALDDFDAIDLVFDATSATAHVANARALRPYGKRLVDLTPAALGPYVVPAVNLEDHLDAPDVNMVTCGGQATIPIVAAIARIAPVPYAEIVASIASRSAGPGTRANIDEFTATTARAIEVVGGAARGKAIIVLNPAEPPMIMRDTVFCLVPVDASTDAITASIGTMVADVAGYVPGYRAKQQVQFSEPISPDVTRTLTGDGTDWLVQVSTYLEVEGAAHYLPAYAGNLDIMTSAARRVGERLAQSMSPRRPADGRAVLLGEET